MKIKLISTLISTMVFAGAATATQVAAAADGTITFAGSVTAQTCTIKGNGSNSGDFTVTLPTVSTGLLDTAGKTAGLTPFSIALTGCTPGSGKVHAFFLSGPTTDTGTGRLILRSGGASNVQIGLKNNDFSDINAGADDAAQNSKSVAITDGKAVLHYNAQYVATGAATAGVAATSVMYTLSYQ